MLRKQSGLFLAIHQIIDLIIIYGCFSIAYYTKINLPGDLGGLTSEYSYNILLLLALISFHTSFRLMGVYEPYRRLSLRAVVFKVLKGTLIGTLGMIIIGYLMHFDAVSRLFIIIFFCYSFVSLALFKGIIYLILARSRTQNYNIRTILLIGSRQRALDFIKAIRKRKSSGYRIRGCLETNDQEELVGDRVHGSIKIIGTMKRFKELLEQETIDEVVFGIPLKNIENVHEYIYLAEEMGKTVRVLPDFQINTIKYLPQTATVNIEDFLGVTTLSLSSIPENGNALLLKSFIDYGGAFIGIVLLSPFFLLVSMAIKCTSKGPVFFSQERSGLNGREI